MGEGEPKAGLAMGNGEESLGLVRATAGWSLFRKLSLTWLYLCCDDIYSLINGHQIFYITFFFVFCCTS